MLLALSSVSCLDITDKPSVPIEVWLPQPKRGVVISSQGKELSCFDAEMSQMFATPLSTLKRINEVLDLCERWSAPRGVIEAEYGRWLDDIERQKKAIRN